MTLRERLERVAIAHTDGPRSELAGAVEVTESGRRETNMKRVVAAVRAHPGSSGIEVARYAGLEVHEARRRLTDAKAAGYVRQGTPEVRPGLTGTDRLQVTWWPVERQPSFAPASQMWRALWAD